jgi:hypothetical protein
VSSKLFPQKAADVMYFYFLYGRFSDGLNGVSSFVPTASEQSPALLLQTPSMSSPWRKPILAGSHPVPPAISRHCDRHRIMQCETEPNSAVPLSIESVDRGTGENSRLGCAQ